MASGEGPRIPYAGGDKGRHLRGVSDDSGAGPDDGALAVVLPFGKRTPPAAVEASESAPPERHRYGRRLSVVSEHGDSAGDPDAPDPDNGPDIA